MDEQTVDEEWVRLSGEVLAYFAEHNRFPWPEVGPWGKCRHCGYLLSWVDSAAGVGTRRAGLCTACWWVDHHWWQRVAWAMRQAFRRPRKR
jgi:hypothetical protein